MNEIPAPQAVVVIIGPPGAGKSSTGARVARLLGVPFVDTDKVIVAEHGTISDLFEQHGEPHFRRLEREIVARSLRQPVVVSVGGGAVLDADTQADLAALAVVQVDVTAEAVQDRINDRKRPLVKDGIAAWTALVEPRRPLYDRLAGVTIDTSRRPMDRVAEDVVDWLRVQGRLPAATAAARG